MYVYMLKILHNGWNIDLILKLQRFNAVKQIYITLNNIKKKKKIQWKLFFYVVVSHMLIYNQN
jgi:hypothetical protein